MKESLDMSSDIADEVNILKDLQWKQMLQTVR